MEKADLQQRLADKSLYYKKDLDTIGAEYGQVCKRLVVFAVFA
jgi:hypothetical protein